MARSEMKNPNGGTPVTATPAMGEVRRDASLRSAWQPSRSRGFLPRLFCSRKQKMGHRWTQISTDKKISV